MPVTTTSPIENRLAAPAPEAVSNGSKPVAIAAVVIGGTSAELNLKTVKLASARYLDELPPDGNKLGRAFRDRALEADVLAMTQRIGVGAQFAVSIGAQRRLGLGERVERGVSGSVVGVVRALLVDQDQGVAIPVGVVKTTTGTDLTGDVPDCGEVERAAAPGR